MFVASNAIWYKNTSTYKRFLVLFPTILQFETNNYVGVLQINYVSLSLEAQFTRARRKF